MQNKTLYLEWFKAMIPSAAIYIAAILLIIFMPVKSYWSILFLGLSLTLGLKLYSDISSKTKPSWKEYNKTTTATIFFVSLTSLLYSVGGWFGIFGLGLVIIIFAGWRIYQQYDLFDNLTTYISDVVFKGKSYNFDPLKKNVGVDKDEISREDRGESIGDTQQRASGGVEEQQPQERHVADSGIVVEENLQILPSQDNIIYTEKPSVESDDALSNMFQALPTLDNSQTIKKRRKKKKSKKKKLNLVNTKNSENTNEAIK